MTTCQHGCADPRMCDDCRRTKLGPASDDPDIRAAWTAVRRGLEEMLRPYVQAHVLDDLVRRAVAELLAGAGWKPPLRPPPDWLRTARVAHALAAEDLA
ncbi:hypothetical protein ACWEU6_21730 [Streptosporangium sandarakinum]